jgi:DNA-binding NarL/FixJ family response regulator
MEEIRILLVDDHDGFRQGLRRLLKSIPRFKVIGEAADGARAVQLARELTPDVIVMDIRMPGMDGVEATRQIRAQAGATKILGLSATNEPDSEALLNAGAERVLNKATAFNELVNAILAPADELRE